MKNHIEERVLEIAQHMMIYKTTVRECAKVFGVSKSTIHKDMSERLVRLNPQMAAEVKKILEYNKSVRHLRGGQATKDKYAN